MTKIVWTEMVCPVELWHPLTPTKMGEYVYIVGSDKRTFLCFVWFTGSGKYHWETHGVARMSGRGWDASGETMRIRSAKSNAIRWALDMLNRMPPQKVKK